MKRTYTYTCSCCAFSVSKKDVVAHEAICPNVKTDKEIALAHLDTIRLTAECPEHLERLLEEYALKHKEVITVKLSVTFNECISNGKYPIGREGDWTSPDRPKGYPGFTGNIYFTKEEKSGKYAADLFDGWHGNNVRGINLQSGGGGWDSSYGITIFLQDFPIIEKKVKTALEIQVKEKDFNTLEANKVKELQIITKDRVIADSVHKAFLDRQQEMRNQISKLQIDISEIEKQKVIRVEQVKNMCMDEKCTLLPQTNPFALPLSAAWIKALSRGV